MEKGLISISQNIASKRLRVKIKFGHFTGERKAENGF